MKRQEVLSLLERFPELFDGDDELLHDLITDSHPEPAEKDAARSEPMWRADSEDRPAKQPR
jgi:hypothetical protein